MAVSFFGTVDQSSRPLASNGTKQAPASQRRNEKWRQYNFQRVATVQGAIGIYFGEFYIELFLTINNKFMINNSDLFIFFFFFEISDRDRF